MNNKMTFSRLTRQKYFRDIEKDEKLTEQFNIALQSSEGGCIYEFSISFYNINGKECARAEIFCDAFTAFEKNSDLFECLAHTVAITPDGLHKLLLKLGYNDVSDYKDIPKEEVYVCYVQNYYGFADGEDVVERMRIFSNQEQIDKWFCEQVERGNKKGYVPEEETTEFIGVNDFDLTMTLTKDGIGAASFGIVCKPFEIER